AESSAGVVQDRPAVALEEGFNSLPGGWGARHSGVNAEDPLGSRLTIEVGRCRSLRQSLGLAVVAFRASELLNSTQSELMERLLDRACRVAESSSPESLGFGRRLLLLP